MVCVDFVILQSLYHFAQEFERYYTLRGELFYKSGYCNCATFLISVLLVSE